MKLLNEKYKLEKIISYGSNAVMYKVKIKGKYYALRRQKISDSDALIIKGFEKKNLEDLISYSFILNIYINQILNNFNSSHFLKLYDYKLSKTNFKYPIDDFILKNKAFIEKTPQILDKFKEQDKMRYSVDTLTDLKDGDLDEIINTLNKKQIYSLFIQIFYALNILHSNNILHNDPNIKNICYIKTNIKNIKIFNLLVPTYGYIYSLIDYESSIFISMNSNIKIWDFLLKNNNQSDFLRLLINILTFDKETKLEDNNYDYEHIMFLLSMIKNNPNDDKPIKNNKYFYLLNQGRLTYTDIKYFIKYSNNYVKLIKYFYNLISKK